jgi:hypothetical protein
LPLLAWAIATVNVPVAIRVRALSTYQRSEEFREHMVKKNVPRW